MKICERYQGNTGIKQEILSLQGQIDACQTVSFAVFFYKIHATTSDEAMLSLISMEGGLPLSNALRLYEIQLKTA